MSFNVKVEKNIPLRIKIADHLRELIRKEYSEGGQIPSEDDLSSMLGISRGTLRQALSILDEEGFIVRKHGSGTYINPHVLRLRVRADLPFRLTDLIENAGYKASVNILEKKVENASSEIANNLQLSDNSEVLVLERLFFADDQPAIYLRDHISTNLVGENYSTKNLENFLFEFLRDHCSIKLLYGLSEIIPTIADENIARELKVEKHKPMLMCCDTHFSEDNRPVVFSQVYYKDEIIRFSLKRKYS